MPNLYETKNLAFDVVLARLGYVKEEREYLKSALPEPNMKQINGNSAFTPVYSLKTADGTRTVEFYIPSIMNVKIKGIKEPKNGFGAVIHTIDNKLVDKRI